MLNVQSSEGEKKRKMSELEDGRTDVGRGRSRRGAVQVGGGGKVFEEPANEHEHERGSGGGGAVQFHFWRAAELDSTPVSELSKGETEKKAEKEGGENNQSKIHSERAAAGGRAEDK